MLEKNIFSIAVSGGVSANKYFREELKKLDNANVVLVDLKFSGDNAAMIAYYAANLIDKQ